MPRKYAILFSKPDKCLSCPVLHLSLGISLAETNTIYNEIMPLTNLILPICAFHDVYWSHMCTMTSWEQVISCYWEVVTQRILWRHRCIRKYFNWQFVENRVFIPLLMVQMFQRSFPCCMFDKVSQKYILCSRLLLLYIRKASRISNVNMPLIDIYVRLSTGKIRCVDK